MAGRRLTSLIDLIGCGETTWDAERRILGAADLPLSESGRAHVLALAARLPRTVAAVHHPPDEAATETARLVARSAGLKTRSVPELADPHLGLLEGLTRDEFAERFPTRFKQWQEDPLALAPPEGEELADARARLFAAVVKVVRRSRSGEVILVLHALSMGFLRCWLSDRPSRDIWSVLEDGPRPWRYVVTPQIIEGLEDAARPIAGRT